MNKRFTLCEEQEYTDGWSIGITDHQTKEPFDSSSYMFHSSKKSATKEEMEDLIIVINQLADENEQLREEIKDYQDTLANYEELIQKLRKHNTTTYLTIKEAYQNERTEIGRSVLKQLLNQME